MRPGLPSETASMALLTEERELTDDPFIDRVLEQLAGDESLHARVGWIYLSKCWEVMDEEARDKLNVYLPHALGYFEARMLESMPLGRLPDDVLVDACKLGFSASSRSRELLYETLEQVILPNLDALGLDARQAWAERI